MPNFNVFSMEAMVAAEHTDHSEINSSLILLNVIPTTVSWEYAQPVLVSSLI